MNKIDILINHTDHTRRDVDGEWVIARPENFKRHMTSLSYRLKEAWNVLNGKAETLYYHKQ